jgi:UrcA family protein
MLKIALIAAAAAALFAAPARAEPSAAEVVHLRVAFGDLDVRAAPGAIALMGRIAQAAAQVCGGRPDSVIHDDRVRFDRCRAEAFGRAVTQLDPAIISAVSHYPPGTIRLAGD